ncbi:SpvB/TcaC N-terminal domain-containing protein, partial [Flavobacterium sp. MK4S-17]|uniref:SpvB/TcaC N-terminal domain-containing protein n=1 Tax=Flavobacterium sp. MK4S-17 TaxID=2543737 RepID=UPI0013596227
MGKKIPVINGVFEEVFTDVSNNVDTLTISYSKNEKKISSKFPLHYKSEGVKYHFLEPKLADDVILKFDSTSSLSKSNTSIYITAQNINEDANNFIAEGLYFKDIRVVNSDVDNVTSGSYKGYRIKKSKDKVTSHFKLHLKYDANKIPDGYTAKDIKTFCFDQAKRTWKALPVDSLDVVNKEVITDITHQNDTDYINGIIKIPESPETASFTPTTIADMKYVDPAAGVVSIAPPAPNSTGALTTSFPIKLPQGRNGLQPPVQVSYNSDGGNGWMGVGWNISTPAITLSTKWGVPTFNPLQESEIYLLNGEELVLDNGTINSPEYTNPHRQGNIPRLSERIFYTRKEGSFQKIIRHGTNTQNYWWEVIDKMGNRSFYGNYDGQNSNTVIRNQGSMGNICHWALKRTEDPYGNYIDYSYTKLLTSLDGGTTIAQEFYLNKIKYTMHASLSNYYEVNFLRNNYTVSSDGNTIYTNRKDIIINARNGYVQLIDDLLTEIQVSYIESGLKKNIRTYRFDYKEKAFQKQQLIIISEFDTNDELFYSNTIDYFDDISTGPIINNTAQKWTGSNDNISSSIANLPGLNFVIPQGSVLGTSVSSGFSIGMRGGIGPGMNVLSVSNTIGGSLSSSKNSQDTRISFIDINGDGLPDKVYKNNSGVRYRENNGTGFGPLYEVNGISRLTTTKSRTRGSGFDANIKGFGVGKSRSKTRSETDNYFVDFNGDGLPDLISNKKVYFNHGTDSMEINFNTNVNGSENTILSGGMDASVVDDLNLPGLPELREEYPQFDHVKVWKAPYTGTIIITGNAELIYKNNNGVHPNTFKLNIQQNENIIKSQTLSSVGQETSMAMYYIDVDKDDIFYFRTHNLDEGYGGEIKWNPIITYTNSDNAMHLSVTDENGNYINKYSVADDFIMNNGGDFQVHGNITNINFNLPSYQAYQFSDNIRFVVKGRRINNEDGSEISLGKWIKAYNNYNGVYAENNSLNISSTPAGYTDMLEFYVESNSNVNWKAINWKPIVSTNTGNYYPPVNYSIYNNNLRENKYWFDTNQLISPIIYDTIPDDEGTAFLKISHNLFSHLANNPGILNHLKNKDFPIKINWVVKGETSVGVKLLNSTTFYLHRTGQILNIYQYKFNNSEFDPNANFEYSEDYKEATLTKKEIKDIIESQGRLFSAFYVNNEKFSYNADITLKLHPDQESNYSFSPIKIDKPFHALSITPYGILHRGWSQFLYNGGYGFEHDEDGEIVNVNNPEDFGSAPIDKDLFVIDNESNVPGDVPGDIDPDDVQESDSPIRYTFYIQDNENRKYVNQGVVNRTIVDENTENTINAVYGYNENNDLTAVTGRFGEGNLYDVYVDPNDIISGNSGYFFGMSQRSISKGKAKSANFGYGSATESNAESKVLNQYVDLNGDRYPDMVSESKIQYTDMLGGISNNKISNSFITGDKSEDITFGITVAAIKPNSTSGNTIKGFDTTINVITNNNISSGINASKGSSFNSKQWLDINGDGLPDKVTIAEDAVKVRLNIGYGFSEEIIWGSGYNDIKISTRENIGLGPSFSFGASFAAGFGGAKSTAITNAALLNINGDQLPDLVIKKTATYYEYYLNKGNGFSTSSTPFYNGKIEEDVSVSGNVFASFTYGFWFPVFFVPIKVVFSPSVGVNASFSEKTVTLQDINGDGLYDVLSKDTNNGNLTARLNKTGKTHLLKKVNTPLGGSWSVNYKRDGNTYDMPQSKWVLSEIITDDGFNGDAQFKPNTTLTTINYLNAKHSRREREFLGYEKVEIEQRNPDDLALYRKVIKSYHNENYYLSGVEKSNALYNSEGQMLSEEKTFYNLLNPDNPIINLNANAANNYLQQGLSTLLLDKSRLFIAPVKVKSSVYENGGQVLTHIKEFTKYDNAGNILNYIDRGQGAEDTYMTSIEYYSEDYFSIENSLAFPKTIAVYKTTTNQLLRYRSAIYNDTGKLKQITVKLNEEDNNDIMYHYDVYGNMEEINEFNNLDDQGTVHYTKYITYDDKIHTYPVEFTNTFGESSSMQYNYLFGIPTFTTDINGESMRTRIDNRGRVVEVTGPNELALGENAWTIRMQYKGEENTWNIDEYNMRIASGRFVAVNPASATPTNAQHYAITRHFDPEYAVEGSATSTNQLLTISIIDGLGQPIQVKKTHQVGENMKWLVSGFESKDAFGRTIKTYLPAVQGYTNNINTISSASLNYFFVNPGTMLPPTEMTYDEKDRVRTLKQPGETQLAYVSYSIENNMLVQNTTNENNQTLKVYTDVRGRQRKTVQNDEITTKFEYNAINELIRVIDNNGFISSYVYDLAGRKTEVRHPDRGMVTFKYDPAGRMISQSNSNLLEQQQEITYHYNHNRLVKIKYPLNPQNDVNYIYGEPGDELAESENAVGRILQQEDATGVQVFGYGRMGEVTKTLRSVSPAGYMPFWFFTEWKYDSWNRVQEIIYPSMQIVSYDYNNAGMLKAVNRSAVTNSGPEIQPIVTDIGYTEYGERQYITFGNVSTTEYTYDERRRLSTIITFFADDTSVAKEYHYDALSNIIGITSMAPEYSLPEEGKIGGPAYHTYIYDDYNRLKHAEGGYTGPNDFTTPYLRQQYTLDMEYNTNHTIKRKTQKQWQGPVTDSSEPLPDTNGNPVHKTSYVLDYGGYATGAYVVGDDAYGYQQPHAPRIIKEKPSWGGALSLEDPRLKSFRITYDRNGNQIKTMSTVGNLTTPLRVNIWDEENRLKAVDLKPDNPTSHPIAIYTYDADGNRVVRYNYERIDIALNSQETSNEISKDNTLIYPSGLMMGRVRLPHKGHSIITTNFYYIGSERIAAGTGRPYEFENYPSQLLNEKMPELDESTLQNISSGALNNANAMVASVHNNFGVQPPT